MIKSIKQVAVLTNNTRVFNSYTKSNKIFGEEYILVQKSEDLRGRVFSRRVLLEGYQDLKDCDELLACLISRIKI